jgi:hypothetical protein
MSGRPTFAKTRTWGRTVALKTLLLGLIPTAQKKNT